MDAAEELAPGPVLVSGTDPDAVEFLVATIRRGGFACQGSSSNDAASALVRSDPAVSLVIVDTDLDAVRSIRALANPELAATLIVVLGAPGVPAAAATDARDAGATHWVERPVAETTLLNGIRHLLES